MKSKPLILPLMIILLCTLALYILIAYPLLRDPAPIAIEAAPESRQGDQAYSLAPEDETADGETEPATSSLESIAANPGGRKQLEIYGRVFDTDRQPLANVVIAEERYYATTRSDSDGYYRLPVELPRHRYPVLHFLRTGFDSHRVKLRQTDLGQHSEYQLDVSLAPALDSVTLEGWVASDLGLGLEDARIELSASYTRNKDSFYLTTFSDENGNFQFEGVRAGETYELSANLSPEYIAFENPEFVVTRTPAPVNVILRKLEFVDLGGMVVNRAGEPVGNYEIYVTNESTGVHTKKIVSDSSGFFSLRRFPLGEISFATRGPEYYRISGMRLDDDSYQNLQIVVDRGGHHLSGWVSDENGVAVDRAMVTVDRKFERGEIEYTSYRSQSTGADGKFAFDSLGAGKHHVTVYSWGYEKQEFDFRLDAQADEIFVALKRIE